MCKLHPLIDLGLKNRGIIAGVIVAQRLVPLRLPVKYGKVCSVRACGIGKSHAAEGARSERHTAALLGSFKALGAGWKAKKKEKTDTHRNSTLGYSERKRYGKKKTGPTRN